MPSLIDLLKVLTKGARAALPYLEAAVETAKTANEILETAKELGYTIRRQTGLDIIGALRSNIDARRYIRITPPHVPLDPTHYGESIGRLLRNYSYKVALSIIDPETEERSTEHVTVSSNEALSQEDVLSRMEFLFGARPCDVQGEIDSATVTDALKSPFIVE